MPVLLLWADEDHMHPLTVAEDAVIAIETVGSAEAGAEPAATRPPATESRAARQLMAATAMARRGVRGLMRYDIRFVLSIGGAGQARRNDWGP